MSRIILTLALVLGLALAAGSVLADATDAGAVAATAPVIAPAAVPPAPALPADALLVSAQADPVGYLGSIVAAARAGQWRLVASGLLIAMMWAASFVRERFRWTRGDRGGAVLVMVVSLAGTTATALATDAPLDWRLFMGAAGVAFTAVGAFTWVRRLLAPKDAPR